MGVMLPEAAQPRMGAGNGSLVASIDCRGRGGWMKNSDELTYHVIPVSIQPEGDEFIVGNPEIEEFYQFPIEGVRVIQHLQGGASVAEVKTLCAGEFDAEMDVDSFVELLCEIGFITHPNDESAFKEKKNRLQNDGRIVFKGNVRLAKAIFSVPGLLFYASVISLTVRWAIVDPALRPNVHALYITHNLTVALLSLLFMQMLVVAIHELAHMLAAARYGISSKMGIGNRLWNIVAEADLSGIYALPKAQRYLPLAAGMLADLLSISIITLAIKAMQVRGIDSFAIQLAQALILQIVFTICWQFNVFLKTDVYYIICNYCNYSNLDVEARIYLKHRLHDISFGKLGLATQDEKYQNLNLLRVFSCIWLTGRAVALTLLCLVVIPTVGRYGRDAYLALHGVSSYNKWDIILFAVLSIFVSGGGVYLWLKEKFVKAKGRYYV